MKEYISDSDTETGSIIPVSKISRQKLEHNLSKLNDESKRNITTRLIASGYGHLIHGALEIDYNTTDSMINNDVDFRNDENNDNNINDDNDHEHENIQNVLLTLIPLAKTASSRLRRGLRKRNFASTHPYLADQAHWLGIASVDYLNDIYEESQDLEAMLKLLNQQYLIKKRKYPHEDRYKSKTFYKFLGRTNPNAINGSLLLSQYENETEKSDSNRKEQHDSQIDINMSEDSAYESDDSEINLNRHRHTHIPDSDDNNGSLSRRSSLSTLGSLIDVDTLRNEIQNSRNPDHNNNDDQNMGYSDEDSNDGSEAEEDQMVRVGGRFRSERTVLRGVLPESAKRLDTYGGKKGSAHKKSKKPIEKRRGLAVKKKGLPLSKNSLNVQYFDEGDLYNEVYQDQSTMTDHYIPFNDHNLDKGVLETLEASDAFDAKYDNYISLSSDSDSEIDSYMSDPIARIFSENDNHNSHNGTISEQQRLDSYLSTQKAPLILKQATVERVQDTPEIDRDLVTSTRKPSVTKGTSERRRKTYSGNRQRLGHSGRSQTLRTGRVSKPQRKTLKNKSFNPGAGSPRQTTILPFSSVQLSRVSESSELSHGIPRKTHTPSNEEVEEIKEVDKKVNEEYSITPNLSNYYFRKNPNLATTVFEAESNRKFIKLNRFTQMPFRADSLKQSNQRLIDVDIERLYSLSEGHYSFSIPGPLICHLNGNRYAFNLVNKVDSLNSSQNLLIRITKLLNNTENRFITDDVTECLKILIYWHLASQEQPSEVEWKYMSMLVQSYIKRNSSELQRLLPYLLTLFFIFWKLDERRHGSNEPLKAEFSAYCGYFWKEMFLRVHEESEYLILVLNDVNFSFIWLLLTYDMGLFWRGVELSLKDYSLDSEIFLEGLFYISSELNTKQYNWNCFYHLYDKSRTIQTAGFYKSFLDVCFLLNQRKSWPLEEKLIMKLYGTVTSRKFFNFEDEGLNFTMLTKIYTINDIPNDSFFESFMQFLYYYSSTLTEVSQVKRLATKLLASSHYQYEKGKAHQVAFTNRFNFMILLCQISNLNQNSLATDLVKLVLGSNDVDIYLLTIRALKTYTEIMTSKELPICTEAFTILTDKITLLYLTVPGISKVIVQLGICLKRSFSLDTSTASPSLVIEFFKMIDKLSFRDFSDDISTKVMELLFLATSKLLSHKGIWDRNSKLITAVNEKVKSFISQQMGRLPMQSRAKEAKSVSLIERCFGIWVSLSCMVDQNWNKMLFQDFPYMGNSYSREMFVLCLFSNILQFDNLKQHMDIWIETLLKQLVKLNISPYILNTINAMKRLHIYLTDFKKIHMNGNITEMELNTNKLQITLAILTNINERDLLIQNKTNLFNVFMEALNEEYDKCFVSNRFVENSKKIMEHIQLHSIKLIGNLPVYQELANKLGITPISSNQMKWKGLPQLEQLSFLNKELIGSLIYHRDVFEMLDQYTDSSSLNSIFHLISIYMKCVFNNQMEFWMPISLLLDYLVIKVDNIQVDVSNREFAMFFLLLEAMTSLFHARGTRHVDVLRNYQLKALCQTYNLLKKAYFIYDGFKDQGFILTVIDKQVMHSSFPTRVSKLDNSYSSFKYYDISNNYKESLRSLENFLLKPEYEKFNPNAFLEDLVHLMEEHQMAQTAILEFDL